MKLSRMQNLCGRLASAVTQQENEVRQRQA